MSPGSARKASVQIHAVERWLDEGWSPWRIGYGAANLIALTVTVYVYAKEPRHPGAVWWLLAAVAVAAPGLSVKCCGRGLSTGGCLRQPTTLSASALSVSKLLAEGKGLQADIGSFTASWGPSRPLPGALPGKLARWEANVYEVLSRSPELCTLFQKAPYVDAARAISGQAYGRVEYQLKILEGVANEGAGNSKTPSVKDLNTSRIQAIVTAYDNGRAKILLELHEKASEFQTYLSSDGNLCEQFGDIQRWESAALSALSYRPDLWSKFFNARSVNPFDPPKIEEVRDRIGEELTILQSAADRLVSAYEGHQ
jgi:hypothetical protein